MNVFSQEVCDSSPVRMAFAEYGIFFRIWWQLVLWLHGKPQRQQALTDAARRHIIADGFAFYVRLYQGLAVGLIVVAGSLAGMHVVYGVPGSLFWPLGLLSGAVLLIAATQIGTRAVRTYRTAPTDATVYLAVFLVLLIAFLSAVVTAASIVVQHQGLLSPVINLGLLAGVFAFGIGSYLIELVYVISTLSFSNSSCSHDNKTELEKENNHVA